MLHRRVFSHMLWEEPRSLSKFEAWLDLLQLAAFAPYKRIIKGQAIEIDEGECIASLRYLGQRWKWGKNKVASFMALLESEKMIGRRTGQGETVIIIRKYKEYNRFPDASRDTNRDTGGTAAGQRRDKVQEEKEEKEGEEEAKREIPREQTTSIESPPPPSFKEVESFAKSQPIPISQACIERFFDEMESTEWTYRGQACVTSRAWHARFRMYATRWAENERRLSV